MIGALLSVIPALTKLGGKFVMDKDKAAEYAFKTQEMVFALLEKIVTMQTIPWVDAMVKLLFAAMALARPLGSFYLTLKGIDMAMGKGEIGMLDGGLMAMFPSWMGAREVDKSRKHKRKLWGRRHDIDDD